MGATAAVGGAAVVGGLLNQSAADKAASAQENAANTAAGEQRYQFDQTKASLAPWVGAGTNALYSLQELMGLNPAANSPAPAAPTAAAPASPGVSNGDGSYQLGGVTVKPVGGLIPPATPTSTPATPAAPTAPQASPMSLLQADPGYQFRLQQGNQALTNMMSSRQVAGGAALKEAMNYNQGLASQQYQTTLGNLFSLSGTGQNAAAMTGNFGANAASAMGNAAMQGGNAAANASLMGGAGWNNAINGGMNNYLTLQAYNNWNNMDQTPKTYNT